MKELAAHNRLSGTLIPTLFLIALIVIGVIAIRGGAGTIPLVFVSVAVLVNVLAIYGNHKNLRDIFFDDNNLYLKNHNQTEKIAFSDLKSLKLTSDRYKLMGISNHKYSIEYYGSDNNVREVNFWTTLSNPGLDEFTAIVLKCNARFVVKHSSGF